MTKYKTVPEFLADLTPDQKAQVELLRQYILQAEPTLTENIKWNAPNYVFKGIDRITFNLMNKEHVVKILIHKGAVEKEDKKSKPVMNDTFGLVSWNSNIRGTLAFSSIQDVERNAQALVTIFKNWLKL